MCGDNEHTEHFLVARNAIRALHWGTLFFAMIRLCSGLAVVSLGEGSASAENKPQIFNDGIFNNLAIFAVSVSCFFALCDTKTQSYGLVAFFGTLVIFTSQSNGGYGGEFTAFEDAFSVPSDVGSMFLNVTSSDSNEKDSIWVAWGIAFCQIMATGPLMLALGRAVASPTATTNSGVPGLLVEIVFDLQVSGALFLIGITQVAALGTKLANFATVWATETPSNYQSSMGTLVNGWEDCADDLRCPPVGAALFFYLCGFVMSIVCVGCAFLKAHHLTATRRCMWWILPIYLLAELIRSVGAYSNATDVSSSSSWSDYFDNLFSDPAGLRIQDLQAGYVAAMVFWFLGSLIAAILTSCTTQGGKLPRDEPWTAGETQNGDRYAQRLNSAV